MKLSLLKFRVQRGSIGIAAIPVRLLPGILLPVKSVRYKQVREDVAAAAVPDTA